MTVFVNVKHEQLITCLGDVEQDGKYIRHINNLYWEQVARNKMKTIITHHT